MLQGAIKAADPGAIDAVAKSCGDLAVGCTAAATHVTRVAESLGRQMSVLAVSLASFSIAIPVSVAAIGPFEAAVLAAGQLAGLDGVQALSLGFLFHGVSVANYVIWGIIGFLGLGLSPRKVMDSTEIAVDPTSAPSGNS